ncbi:hypothetical protein JTE90_019315 [Oedothorax gibbosus]|uniref:BTB domain-containing protein n=1 Tax=Oedothorax gibbosus TaxID=931172 RepID=A0AAV6TVV7_9ARAC|nr:hypothetical protein JTE90_019315 [Oedothorax gibbosus]
MANLHVMTTSNPRSDYAFSWTIENFLYSSKQLFGPPFSPISGFPESFRFECENKLTYCPTNFNNELCFKYCRVFHVRLAHLNAKELQMYVSADITLSNTKMILFCKSCDIMRLRQTKISLIAYRPDKFNEKIFMEGLRDSKLKLEGTLTFSGYELSTSVSVEPLALQQPSGNCAISELVKDFKAMYEDGRCSDVTFTIGDEKLPAHKAILAARSPVFAEMFEHRLHENITNVTIEDIYTNTFKDFLLFLYTGGVGDSTCESLVSLYPVSKKYQVLSLQKFCVLSLSSVLTVDYASDVLLLADMYEDKEC